MCLMCRGYMVVVPTIITCVRATNIIVPLRSLGCDAEDIPRLHEVLHRWHLLARLRRRGHTSAA